MYTFSCAHTAHGAEGLQLLHGFCMLSHTFFTLESDGAESLRPATCPVARKRCNFGAVAEGNHRPLYIISMLPNGGLDAKCRFQCILSGDKHVRQTCGSHTGFPHRGASYLVWCNLESNPIY